MGRDQNSVRFLAEEVDIEKDRICVDYMAEEEDMGWDHNRVSFWLRR